MAIISTTVQSTASLKFKTGVNAQGKDVFKSQKFSNIKTSASNDDIFAVGTSMGTLLMYPVTDILRDDSNQIINQ
ncbi:MAG: DUF1659 domain-containing protein [Bacillota bacterium]|nr:DUF1659 domain-containing protein [Bacillota bacterium]